MSAEPILHCFFRMCGVQQPKTGTFPDLSKNRHCSRSGVTSSSIEAMHPEAIAFSEQFIRYCGKEKGEYCNCLLQYHATDSCHCQGRNKHDFLSAFATSDRRRFALKAKQFWMQTLTPTPMHCDAYLWGVLRLSCLETRALRFYARRTG